MRINLRSRPWPYRSTIELVATLAVLFSVYLFVDNQVVQSQSPPSNDCSLAELEDKIGSPVHLAVVGEGETQRVVWLGELPWSVVRSGRPCYVFDRTNHLVAWCSETQEGWKYDPLAAEASRAEAISIGEAEQMMQ